MRTIRPPFAPLAAAALLCTAFAGCTIAAPDTREHRDTQADLYAANVLAAAHALEAGDPAVARDRLDRCPPALRNWEWRHLAARLDQSLATLHTTDTLSQVSHAEFNADGSRILTLSYRLRDDDNPFAAHLWDASSGDRIATFDQLANDRDAAAFTRDGTRLVLNFDDDSVKLIHAATGAVAAVLHDGTDEAPRATVPQLVAAPRVLTRAHPDGTEIRCTETGDRIAVLNGHTEPITHHALDDSHERLITLSRNRAARLWDLTTGRELAAVHGATPRGRRAIAFSGNGDARALIATGSRIVMLDSASGAPIATLDGHAGRIYSVASSSDGALVVTASADQTVRLWDGDTGEPITVLHGHTDDVLTASFDTDAQRIVSSASDGTARIWSTKAGVTTVVHAGTHAERRKLHATPDGDLAITSTLRGELHVHDVHTGRPVASFQAKEWLEACISQDGEHVMASDTDGVVTLWEVATARELARLHADSHNAIDLIFDGDRALALTSNGFGPLELLNVRTGQPVNRPDWEALTVINWRLSADRSRVVTIEDNRAARVWDVRTGNQIASLESFPPEGRLRGISDDGSVLLATTDDDTLHTWNASNGRPLARAATQGRTGDPVLSPDGRYIASFDREGFAHVWDARTGELLHELSTPPLRSISRLFAPDSARLFTSDFSGTLRIWDPERGELLAVLRGHTSTVRGAAFSADGNQLITADADGNVLVWHTTPFRDRHAAWLAARPDGPELSELVSNLHTGHKDWHAVAEALRASDTLTPDSRRHALELVTIRAELERRTPPAAP